MSMDGNTPEFNLCYYMPLAVPLNVLVIQAGNDERFARCIETQEDYRVIK